MEPQRSPVPFSATSTHYSEQPSQLAPVTSTTTTDDYDYTYNEKYGYLQHQDSRTERGSKSSNGRAHDSLISHPFSPKASYPPSPSSSISSTGDKQRRSSCEIRQVKPANI